MLKKVAETGTFPDPTQEIMDDKALYDMYLACIKVYRRGFEAGLIERKERTRLKALAATDKEKSLFENFIRSYTAGFHSAMKKDNSVALKNNAIPLDMLLKPEAIAERRAAAEAAKAAAEKAAAEKAAAEKQAAEKPKAEKPQKKEAAAKPQKP